MGWSYGTRFGHCHQVEAAGPDLIFRDNHHGVKLVMGRYRKSLDQLQGSNGIRKKPNSIDKKASEWPSGRGNVVYL